MLIIRKSARRWGNNHGIQFPGLTPQETLSDYTGKQTIDLSLDLRVSFVPTYRDIKNSIEQNFNSPFVSSILLANESDIDQQNYTITNFASDNPYLEVTLFSPYSKTIIGYLFLPKNNPPIFYHIDVLDKTGIWRRCILANWDIGYPSGILNDTGCYAANWYSEPDMPIAKKKIFDFFNGVAIKFDLYISSICNDCGFERADPITFRFVSNKSINGEICKNWARLSQLKIKY